jgi:hypothetical protein
VGARWRVRERWRVRVRARVRVRSKMRVRARVKPRARMRVTAKMRGRGRGGEGGQGVGGGRGGARPRGQPVQPVHLLHAIGGLERLWRRVAAAEDLVLFAQLRHEERGARTAERVRRGCGERVQRVQRRCRACADLGRETAPKQPASETPKRYWK